MPTRIVISSLNGTAPFDVYTCDTGYTDCIYVDTVMSLSDIPYSFDIPIIMEPMPAWGIKVVDDNNCVISEIVT
jgi:hypothetical protein